MRTTKLEIEINEEMNQLFNKIDLVVRNDIIRMKYNLLREQGISSIKAKEMLANDIYKSWKGEPYFLNEKSIINIISGCDNEKKQD